MTKPILSVVVVFHNMIREAERTLKSLSSAYQNNISPDEYEIIAIDNGSTFALNGDEVRGIASNACYYFHETNSVSPVEAANYGARRARGEFIAVIVDGARMASPGLLNASLRAARSSTNAFVCSPAWHLGPEAQNYSMLNGYDQAKEDQLLRSINWTEDGYRLFEISSIAQSSSMVLNGYMPVECSYFTMAMSQFLKLGGFDERFQSPGGGLANQDFLKRALGIPGIEPVVILNEGVFHQFHGGVATNVPMANHPYESFQQEYIALHGERYEVDPHIKPTFVGDARPTGERFSGGELITSLEEG